MSAKEQTFDAFITEIGRHKFSYTDSRNGIIYCLDSEHLAPAPHCWKATAAAWLDTQACTESVRVKEKGVVQVVACRKLRHDETDPHQGAVMDAGGNAYRVIVWESLANPYRIGGTYGQPE